MTAPDPAAAPDEPLELDTPTPRPDDPGRLTLDQSLAELDRAPAHLLEIEARHGFTFGDTGERGPGRSTIAVACSSAGCPRQGRLVQLHDDTVQPVRCGECGAVMHCDHVPELRRERAGTLAAVVEHLITACTVCGTELDRQTRELGPMPLDQIPATIFDRPL